MRQDTLLVRTAPKKALAGLALGLALSFGQTAQAAVVYSQLISDATVNIDGNAISDLGDDVTLAGTERNLTSIDVYTRYFYDLTHTAYTPDLTLTLYASGSVGNPGTVIASSTTIGAPFLVINGGPCFGGYVCEDQTITFLFNPLTDIVPDSFYMAVNQNNFDNNFALHFTYGSPTIGSTTVNTFFRVNGNPDFEEGAFGIPGLQTEINAVPEPATLALLGLGLAGLGFRRRKRA